MKLLLSAICALILSIIYSSCVHTGSDYDEKIDLVPVMLSGDSNWSMMDRDGNVFYEGEFENVPSNAVEGIFSVNENGRYTLYKIGEKEPEIWEGNENLEYVGNMSEGLIPVVFPEKRIQILDKKGVKVCDLNPICGNEIVKCASEFHEGLLAVGVYDNNIKKIKWGFADKTGNIVIMPTYEYVNRFRDGVSVCAKNMEYSKEEKETKYSSLVVINRKGEVLFEIDDDLKPFWNYGSSNEITLGEFRNGHMVLCGERYNYIVDKEGNKTKLSSRIKNIDYFDGKYLIFSTGDDEYGVADVNGEICIKPRYRYILPGIGRKFIARQGDFGFDEEETLNLIDANSDKVVKVDYTYICPLYDWGYITRKDGNYILLGKNLKQKGEEEFDQIRWGTYFKDVSSDYFNPREVVDSIMNNLRVDGFARFILYQKAEVVLEGEEPPFDKKNTFWNNKIYGLNFDLKIDGLFSERPKIWDSEKRVLIWNDESELEKLELLITLPDNHLQKTFEEIVIAMMSYGYQKSSDEHIITRLKQRSQIEYDKTYISELAIYKNKGSISIEITGKTVEESGANVDSTKTN